MAGGRVACGVAVVVTWREFVLFGRRVLDDGRKVWQLPGGWIEPGESPPDAARREVLEETGLELEAPVFVAVTSNLLGPGEQSISLYFEAECRDAASLSNREGQPDDTWQWRQWHDVDDNLYLPLHLLRQTDYQPFCRVNLPTHFSF